MSGGLFSEFKLRDITLRNRIVVSPMCQYSSVDGFASDWHFVHIGSRAVGGAALTIMEASAVEARGRISAADLGIWKDEHIEPLARICRFVEAQGAVPGIQLAHAGRKASTVPPWQGDKQIPPDAPEGWLPVAPSAVPFRESDVAPHALTKAEISEIVQRFAEAADRALRAGFKVIELHAAHGYLAHEFLSPLSNRRDDEYGGSFENRIRFTLECAKALRDRWPERLPLFVRISATDWAEGGWNLEQSIELARRLRPLGVDLIDCSSGGLVPHVRIPLGSGYQTRFAEAIRREAQIDTGAVGMITSPAQADHIIRTGQADLVILARAMLRDPYWPLHAARKLGVRMEPPVQYGRGFPKD